MFIRDPCGIICVIVTYLAVLYADYVVMQWIVLHTMLDTLWGSFNAVLFNLILTLFMVSHLRAVLSDPGVVPLPQSKLDIVDIHSKQSGKVVAHVGRGRGILLGLMQSTSFSIGQFARGARCIVLPGHITAGCASVA